jgi:hypothetical protein
MSTAPLTANDKSAWIRDLVYLAFPEGEARERVLFDLVKQFAKLDPEDPEWLRYKLSVVECRALENVARGLNDAAAEQARLRGVTREIADFAAMQMRGTIEGATITARQLLEDVQASLHDSIAGEAILKCYTEETRQQFAAVIRTIIESSLAQALATSQKQMDGWLKGRARRGDSQRPRRPGSSDARFPGQTARRLELPAVERLCRWASLRLWPSRPGVLAGKAPVSELVQVN